jgi:DNA-binding response OmpR family regulator
MASVLSEQNLAYRMKADEYLIKPITQDELFDTITRTISKSNGIDILIADDDDNFLNLIGQFLKEEGIPYRLARNGEDAIYQMLVKKPDLLILDIMMPKKDGFTVIEEIRNREGIKDTPVIVVTAKDLTNREKEDLYNRTSAVIQKSAVMVDTVMQAMIKRIKEYL